MKRFVIAALLIAAPVNAQDTTAGRGGRGGGGRAVVITVDSNGLFDRRMTVASLAWPDITGIEEFEAEHMRYVGVELRDPVALRSRLRWLPWTARPLNRIFGFPALSISMSLLDGTTDDLVAAIQRLRPSLAVVRS